MDDKASVGKISVSSDSVSTLNSEDFVLVSRQGDETPSTNNGSDDEKTGLKVKLHNLRFFCWALLKQNLALIGRYMEWKWGHGNNILSFFNAKAFHL